MFKILCKIMLKDYSLRSYSLKSYYLFNKDLYKIEILSDGKVIAILDSWKEAYMYLRLL